ncbi:MAG: hypothetical protein C0507_07240 [Cyanobacteria bacterium PR.3.49]|nr:hypothetical protein [Cyanobacteria bacterium PR.3.49]
MLRPLQLQVLESCTFDAITLEQHRSKSTAFGAASGITSHQRNAAMTFVSEHRQVDKRLTVLVGHMCFSLPPSAGSILKIGWQSGGSLEA